MTRLRYCLSVDDEAILRQHSARYPAMTPADAVKLLYQAAFGPGHLVEHGAALQRIRAELETVPADAPLLIEEIGGGFARIYLSHDLPPEVLAWLFTVSADDTGKNKDAFELSLLLLKRLTEEGIFPFTAAELEDYLTRYRAQGMPPVSHSEAYRTAYHPAYRVVRLSYARLLPLLRDLYHRTITGKHVILQLDGFAASGKTTLAKELADLLDGRVIPMDDFFLPMEKRTPERFREPGGNVDYERFREEVVEHLNDSTLTYGVFDCSAMSVTHTRTFLNRTPATIVEGSYAAHPHFGQYADLRVFVECAPEEQIRRIQKRNGDAMLRRFVQEWIPMERVYEEAFRIRETADYLILT